MDIMNILCRRGGEGVRGATGPGEEALGNEEEQFLRS